MKIYKAERDAGLDKILADPLQASVSFLSKIQVVEDEDQKNRFNNLSSTVAKAHDQFDLFYIDAILASIGWNKNDDVFLRDETWAARHTPVDKPFNLEHVPDKIIGHITASYGIDSDGNKLDDNYSIDELPESYDILISNVIYRHLKKKKEVSEAAAQLIDEIKNGEWFVSMEALFTDFDYAVIHANKTQEIIARNQDTAFLTKHLRMYQGSGSYNNMRVGRAVKNITFSGNGLTKNPANENSIIFANVIPFNINKKTEEKIIISTESKEIVMAGENDKTNDALQKQVEQLQARLEKFDEEKQAAKEKAYEDAVASAKAQNTELSNKIKELETSVASFKKADEDAKAKLVEVEKALSDSKAALEAKTAELATIALEAKKTERTSCLVDKGIDKVEASKLVDKFVNLDDEQFNEIVELKAASLVKTDPATKELAEETDTNTSQASAATKELETAKADVTPSLGTDVEDTGVKNKEIISSIASMLGDAIDTKYGKKALKDKNVE